MKRYINDIPFNMIHLCIDYFDNYSMKGRAYNSTVKNPLIFEDINEVFLKFENVFDHNGNPLAWQFHRSFDKKENVNAYCHKPEEVNDYKDLMEYHGDMETMDIVVKSRRLNEWQGVLYVKGQKYTYQSVGELVMRMIHVLENKMS